MKYILKNHEETAEKWASRSQETGQCGNVSFDTGIIYSYGWWPMAVFINDNTALVRNWNYSVTTSKHLGYVREALRKNNIKQIECHNVTDSDKGENLTNLVKELQDNINALFRARKRYILGDIIKENIKNISDYLEYVPHDLSQDYIESLSVYTPDGKGGNDFYPLADILRCYPFNYPNENDQMFFLHKIYDRVDLIREKVFLRHQYKIIKGFSKKPYMSTYQFNSLNRAIKH